MPINWFFPVLSMSFFTNISPGITFAIDSYVLAGKIWGTIEVGISRDLCEGIS